MKHKNLPIFCLLLRVTQRWAYGAVMLMVFSTAWATTPQLDLTLALQREYANLSAELQSLETQLKETDVQERALRAASTKALADFETKLAQLEAQERSLKQELSTWQSGTKDATLETLSTRVATLAQNSTSAMSADGQQKSEITDFGTLREGIQKAIADLADQQPQPLPEAAVHAEDGQKTTKTIVSLAGRGFVAMTQGAGKSAQWDPVAPLVPERNGTVSDFALVPVSPDARDVLLAAQGTGAVWVPYAEATQAHRALSSPTQRSTADLVAKGGPIGYATITLGVVALLVALARTAYLARNRRILLQTLSFFESRGSLPQDLRRRRLIDAFQKAAAGSSSDAEMAVGEKLTAEMQTLDRGATFVAVVAGSAPLLGLLGTVSGMIATFDTITVMGAGNPAMLSGGISEALVTTLLGLVVAIPALFLSQLLGAEARRQKMGLERCAYLALIQETPQLKNEVATGV